MVTQIHTCLNCSAAIRTGPFCERCGQRNAHARLGFRDLLEDIKVQLLEWDLPWLRTLGAMLLRPGRACREYMDGKRVRYVNPLKYLVYLMTVALLLVQVLPERYGLDPRPLMGESANDVIAGQVHEFLLRAVLCAPLMALLFRLLYSRTKYNNAEVSCFILYTLGNGVLLAMLLNTTIEAFGDLVLDIQPLLFSDYALFVLVKVAIIIVTIFAHTTYMACTFFEEAWYLSWSKVFAAYLAYMVVAGGVYNATSDLSGPGATAVQRTQTTRSIVLMDWNVYEQMLVEGMQSDRGIFATRPGDYGRFLLDSGRTEEALYYLLRAAEEETTGGDAARIARSLLATAYLQRGQQDFAATILEADVYGGDELRMEVALQNADFAQILALAERIPATQETNTELARLLLAGDRAAALDRIRIIAGTPNAGLALVVDSSRWAAQLGDPELAWLLFEKLESDQKIFLWHSLWMPYFSEVRKLPGFKDFVRNEGLADYWRTSGHWADRCHAVADTDFECF